MGKDIGIKELQDRILKDKTARLEIAKLSHFWFFHTYFARYVKYGTADFQKKMFYVTEDDSVKSAVIVAFRGSAKSTIMSFSYPIWAMIAKGKKYMIILSQTQQLCKLMLANIKDELENNPLLIKDFGPFRHRTDEWNSNMLLVNRYEARIAVVSCGESIRGIRHKETRPDLIICDDVEDLSSVKTREARSKTYNWLTGDVIPAGDKDTKLVVIGNMLHEDCLVMRLKQEIDKGEFRAKFYSYPLLDAGGDPLWPAKFKSTESIDELRSSTPSEASFRREYLLEIVASEDTIIYPEWISYYDDIEERVNYRFIATGIDLAISQKTTADYTAMVSAKVFGYSKDLKIYILPNSVNEKLSFPDTVNKVKELSYALGGGYPTEVYIEDVGYQRALIQELNSQGLKATGAKPQGQDKRERLSLTSHLIRDKKILFPRKGSKELIGQLTRFGSEAHDDLADAFSILILKILETSRGRPNIRFL